MAFRFCSCLVQIADACVNEIKYLRLNVRDFAPGELKLVEGHVSLSEVSKESKFFGSHDQEGVTLPALTASCTTHTMNVLLGIIWRVELEKKRKLIKTDLEGRMEVTRQLGQQGPLKKVIRGVLSRFRVAIYGCSPHTPPLTENPLK